MRSHIIIFFIVVVCSLFSEANATAENIVNTLRGYRLDVGVSSKSLDFEVYDSLTLKTKGTLTEGTQKTLLLSMGTPYTYFKDSHWGYYFELGASSYYMDTQLVGDEEIEQKLGTSVSGRYFYLTPVLFRNYGDKYLNLRNDKHRSFKFGLGIGIGYLKAHGNIIFTEIPSQELHTIDIDDTDISFSALIDYRYNQWLLRAIGSSPGATKGNLGYDIFDFSMDVGYTFLF